MANGGGGDSRARILEGVGICLVFAGCTVVVLGLLSGGLDGSLLGGVPEGWASLWDTWRVAAAVCRLESPLVTTLANSPPGVSMVQQGTGMLPALPLVPLVALVGPVAAYNLAVAGSFVLAGLAMHLVARRFGFSRWVAYVTGAFFAFGPIRLGSMASMGGLQSCWLPVLVGSFMLFASRRDARSSVLLGLVTGLVLVSSLPVAVLAALLVALLVATGGLRRDRGEGAPARGRGPLLAAGVMLLVALPMVVGFVADVWREGWYGGLAAGAHAGTGDLVAFLVDWSWYRPGPDGALFLPGQTAFLGGSTLVLGALGFGCRLGDPRARGLMAAAFVLFVMSLGPELIVAGSRTGVPLPSALVGHLPLVGPVCAAVPWRAGLWLTWTLLAGFGLTVVEEAMGRFDPSLAKGAVVVLGAVALAEFTATNLPQKSPFPAMVGAVEALAADPRAGSVFEVFGGWEGFPGHAILQIRLGRPSLTGPIEFVPPSVRRRADASPLLGNFLRVVEGRGVVPAMGSRAAQEMTREARRSRVRWVTIPLVRNRWWAQVDPLLLRRLDRMVRQCLPVRATVFEMAPDEEREARRRLAGGLGEELWRGQYLWRVYELELPESP